MKQGILFDLDGTLWDSSSLVANAWNQVIAQQLGDAHTITPEDMYSLMGKSMDQIARELFPAMPFSEAMDLMDRCCVIENQHVLAYGGNLYPHLEQTLKSLQTSGFSLFIVSNCQTGYVKSFLTHYGFFSYFADYEEFGRTGLSKGENIRLVIARQNITHAIYLGDTQGDQDAAEEAKVPFVFAQYGFGSVSRAAPSISALEELPALSQILFARGGCALQQNRKFDQ